MNRTVGYLVAFTLVTLEGLSYAEAAAPAPGTYTLYRDSVVSVGARLHVASFDTSESAQYNRENCEQARELFQGQPKVRTKFWCESGRFSATAPGAAPELSKQFATGLSEPRRCNPSAAELAKPESARQAIDYRCQK